MKKIIRENYKKIRDYILDRKEKSQKIIKKILITEEYENAKIIAVYNSFSSEVETKDFIEKALSDEKIVVLPKVIGKNIKFYKIKSLNDCIEKSSFGILEPTKCIEEINNIDLIIVPGICFDKFKNRLGYGGGYYDRFLFGKNFTKIGICFEEQIYKEKLPVNDTDVKMDIVITDRRIY